MDKQQFLDKFKLDLESLGVQPGRVLLVHASLKSLDWVPGGAETVIQGLLSYIGKNGTLLMPALSYLSVTRLNPIFDVRSTPSCVGAIPEYFRLHPGTTRSIHPTHSVCAFGPLSDELIAPHAHDSTPCGMNSPFHRLPDFEGQIMMLGCGLRPNTSMHAIEEIVEPPYLFGQPIVYSLTNADLKTTQKEYIPHNFSGWEQRYDRITNLLTFPDLCEGKVLSANAFLIDTQALKKAALIKIRENTLYFVDKINKSGVH